MRLLLLGCLLLVTALARADTLVVVVPTSTSLTEEFINVLRQQRADDTVLVHQLDSPHPIPAAAKLITLGSQGLEWRLKQHLDTPTIATYVSNSSLPALSLPPIPAHVQILLANPAPLRQLKLAKLLTPRLSEVGILYSAQHQGQMQEWEAASRQIGLTVFSLPLGSQDNLGRRMIDLLDNSDVLVAIDDPTIYNADNLKTILLSSYTRNKVLIGPSAPFINAGSLSTTYSTATQMALSVNRLLDQPWQPGRISYPQYFSVLSNAQVARSLGFPPPNDDTLAEQLRRQEVGQ